MTHTNKDSKKYVDAVRRFDRDRQHGPGEAVDLVKSLATAKFDETVELAVRLGVDPRKADQIVRGTVGLPAGTGKNVRVAVFAAGPQAQEAREAGADIVGADDLAERVQGGVLDFDVAIATPDLMRAQVARLGRILGPRGLMPNPKTGTVTEDVGRAVREFKGGRVEYRTDRYGNIHVPVGKVSFDRRALLENIRAVIEELQRAKQAAAKGRYMRGITLSSTLGPGVKVDPNPMRALEDELAGRLSSSSAALLTEYRGLNVRDLAALRSAVRDAGGEYKIYKNTLVRLAVRDLELAELDALLTGPTAIAFVDGDAVVVAKSLRDFARTNPNLVIKGGLLGKAVLTAADAGALADVAPREVLLAQFAGALAAPLRQFAGLLAALPRNFAYGLKA